MGASQLVKRRGPEEGVKRKRIQNGVFSGPLFIEEYHRDAFIHNIQRSYTSSICNTKHKYASVGYLPHPGSSG